MQLDREVYVFEESLYITVDREKKEEGDDWLVPDGYLSEEEGKIDDEMVAAPGKSREIKKERRFKEIKKPDIKMSSNLDPMCGF